MTSDENVAFSDIGRNIELPDEFLEDDIDEQEAVTTWEDSWLYKEYKKRRAQERDFFGIVVGENDSTGTGKTTLACKLADNMDATRDGLTEEKVSAYVDEIMKMYKNLPEGSAIVADEGQGMADNRRGMSEDNVKLSQAMSRARFREIYVLMTMPSTSMLDNRIKSRADFLIVCDEDKKGIGRVYELFSNDLDGGGKVMTRKKEEITWDSMDHHPAKQKLDKQKEDQFDALLEDFFNDGKSEEKEERQEIKEEAKQMAIELYTTDGNGVNSYADVQDRLPTSPFGQTDEWSNSKLSDWLTDYT